VNAERLLNLARSLREAAHKERFTMKRYVHTCGTPACAFGHYAGRPDLQDFVRIEGECIFYAQPDEDGDHLLADYDDPQTLKHFGISEEQAVELFREDGCGQARTADEAAKYIEDFVAAHTTEVQP
jgi:hypothetical protein